MPISIKSSKWPLIIGLVLVLCGCNESSADQRSITIATAANMQFAMEAISAQFTKQTGIECQLVVSSSGKLTAQIKEGAPYDLFVAANMKYPEEIFRSGLTPTPPVIYAYGKLVLWTMKKDLQPEIGRLADASIKQIAMANPKTAPYGQAAMEVLQQQNLDTAISEKLVFGESIAQTNQFITTQAADIGFTAMSVVLSPRMQGRGQWIAIEERLHSPIAQGLLLLKTTEEKALLSRQFYDFLFSASAQVILKDFGYKTVAKQQAAE